MWFWGPESLGEWQALYRLEGARRALRAAREEALEQARWRGERGVLDWDVVRTRAALEAAAAAERRRREEHEAAERERTRQWWVAEAALLASSLPGEWGRVGGRNRWVYQERLRGRSLQEIARDINRSSQMVRLIVAKQRRRFEEVRRKLHMRAHLARVVDPGGPRDVWLEYYPPPDPRFANMVAVRP